MAEEIIIPEGTDEIKSKVSELAGLLEKHKCDLVGHVCLESDCIYLHIVPEGYSVVADSEADGESLVVDDFPLCKGLYPTIYDRESNCIVKED